MNLVRLRHIGLIIVLLLTVVLPVQSTRASTHTSTLFSGQYENNSTTIWLRICGQGNAYWFRSAQMDDSVLWNQAYDFVEDPARSGCSFAYKSIIGTQPGGQFKLYSAVLDQVPANPLTYSPPLNQARLDICTVISNGVINCTRQTQTVPNIQIDAPADSQTVSGAIAVSGWAVDKASTSGPGVNSVTISIDTPSGTTDLGNAAYGAQRNDVATLLGDTRFTNSGYTFPVNTDAFNDGPTTLRVNARSAVTGNWTTVQRQITIANGVPPTLTAISPRDIATNTTNIPFVLTGTDFRQPVQVTIGGVTLSTVEVQNATTIHGVLNATLAPGQYDAVVTIGAKSATLPKALTVTQFVEPTQFRAMVYMACDDEQLVTSCDRLFNQLELAMVNDPDLRIVVLWDGYGIGDSAYYLIKPDAALSSRALYQEGLNVFPKGELDTGYGNTLVEFMGWAQGHYPGTYKFLSLVGHGGGWAPDTHPGQPLRIGAQPETKLGGMLWDMHPGNTLSTGEMAQALQRVANGYKIDVVYLDACLMSDLETLAEIAGSSHYIVAHESWTWAIFHYADYFKTITTATTPFGLAKHIADVNQAAWPRKAHPAQISVVSAEQIAGLMNSLDGLSQELRKALPYHRATLTEIAQQVMHVDENADGTISYQGDDYVDLGELALMLADHPNLPPTIAQAADSVTAALSRTVLINYAMNGTPWEFPDAETWPLDRLHGMSIYFPLTDEWKRGLYNDESLPVFGAKTWDDFIQDWYAQQPVPLPPTIRCDDCPPVPSHVSLWMTAPINPFIGQTVLIPVEIAGLENDDMMRGLQVQVQSDNTTVLVPVTTASPSMMNVFPHTAYTQFAASTNAWSAMFNLRQTTTNPVTATGTVVAFPFGLKQAGCATLTFSMHILADANGRPIRHTLRNQKVCVGESSIQGSIYLESRHPGLYANTEVVLEQRQSHYTTSTDAQGHYTFAAVPPGDYTLSVSHPLFVDAQRTVAITQSQVTLPTVGLWGGDMNNDRHIHKNDWYICSAASIPVSDPAFDLNGDGPTDIRDCVIVANNINRPHMRTTNPPQTPLSVYRPSTVGLETSGGGYEDYIRLDPQADGSLEIALLQPRRMTTGLALRLHIPTGTTATQVAANADLNHEFLNWHQDGDTLYIVMLPTGNGQSPALQVAFSQPAGAVGIEAINIGEELGPPYTSIFLPMLAR